MIEVLKYLKAGAIVPVDVQTTKALVDALRQAIAQLESQKPFAYVNVEMRRLEFATDYVKWDTPTTIKLDKIPLYTHLPQRTWVGLTDEEVRQMCGSVPSMKEAVREAEAKLKELNT